MICPHCGRETEPALRYHEGPEDCERAWVADASRTETDTRSPVSVEEAPDRGTSGEV